MREQARTAPLTLHALCIGTIGDGLQRRGQLSLRIVRQRLRSNRGLLQGRRFGPAQSLTPFFFIHLRVRHPQQLIERGLVNHGHLGDPHAQGKPEAPGGERIDEIRALLQSFADLLGGVLARVGHQDTEFIAAKPGEHVGLPKTGAQDIRGDN